MVTTQLRGCEEGQSRNGHSPARRMSRLRTTSCMSIAGLVGSGESDQLQQGPPEASGSQSPATLLPTQGTQLTPGQEAWP